MHNLLLSLALLLPQADGEHYGHAPEQCPNKPGPCPNKPKPAPEPAPEPPHKPKPHANPLGLSDEEWQLCLVLGGIGAIVLVVIGIRDAKEKR